MDAAAAADVEEGLAAEVGQLQKAQQVLLRDGDALLAEALVNEARPVLAEPEAHFRRCGNGLTLFLRGFVIHCEREGGSVAVLRAYRPPTSAPYNDKAMACQSSERPSARCAARVERA